MAFNSFSGPIPESGNIVYGLLDGDYIFYVGITRFLQSRYDQHFLEGPAQNYIYRMRQRGEYPGVKVYGIFGIYGQAEAAEHSLISFFAQSGHKLCNYHQNPRSNQILPVRIDKTIKPKRRPMKLKRMIMDKAFEEYKTFRKWELTPIKERYLCL